MILTPEEKTVLSESSEDTLTVIHNTELAVIAKMHVNMRFWKVSNVKEMKITAKVCSINL